ncbi:uncharacterized protein LOC132937428 [Metopolophium dirhodum]|uniref:uncharacterized protein LOC132937428 n=2 Tax=Metopolophium dirhodum TaxID=44670 RepID=UPI00298FC381|nr:uncharacterized protein LOC132937428 [Metopolophium dirhodum]
MSWSVVEFTTDNSMYVVPSFWLKQDECAWPTQNVSKFITRRKQPNEIEFIYLDAKQIGKALDSYEDAKGQLSIAEFTSDMSSSENKKSRKVRRKRPCDSDVDSIIVKHKKKVLPKSVKEKSSNNLWNVLSTDGSSSEDDEIAIEKGDHALKTLLPNCAHTSISSSITEVTIPAVDKHLVHEKSFNSLNILSADDFQSTVLSYLAKISVDIGEINKTLNRHEDILNTSSFGNRTNESSSSDINQHSNLRFPIQNMTELEQCEEYLTDNTFKSKMVTQLSYLAKKSLSSTVRQITSRLISDTVLQEFSYIGQKKKKIFNKLLICNLIIDAVRNISKFSNAVNLEIEEPLKVFIAGAKSRIKI